MSSGSLNKARVLASAAAVVAATLTIACQSTGPNTTTINGAYSLSTLNGIAMPVITAGPDSIVSEILQFTEAGVFAIDRLESKPGAGGSRQQLQTHMTGTYTRDGTAVVMQYNLGLGTSQALFDGTTVKTTFNGDAKVYVAQ